MSEAVRHAVRINDPVHHRIEIESEFPAGSPVDVGTRWMRALKAKDDAQLTKLSSAPFWKVGLTPEGRLAKKCKKKQKAKNDAQLEDLMGCVAAAGTMYGGFDDKDAIAEIDMREFPEELKKHKKKVAKLVRDGHRLVRYHVNEQGFYVFVVLVLDPDTDFQTVLAALEWFDGVLDIPAALVRANELCTAERAAGRFRFTNYVQQPIAYAFLLARAGSRDAGLAELERGIEFHQLQHLREKLLALLDEPSPLPSRP